MGSTLRVVPNKRKPPTKVLHQSSKRHNVTTTKKIKRKNYKPLISDQQRNVSFVSAKFQVVNIIPQQQLPSFEKEQLLLPCPISNHEPQTDNHHNTRYAKRNNSNDQTNQQSNTPRFLPKSLLENPQQLLDFAQQHGGTTHTFLVKKKDLQNYYQSNAISRTSNMLFSPDSNQQLFLPQNNNIHEDNDINNENDNYQQQNQNNLQLLEKQSQIALQHAPVITTKDIAHIENEKRTAYYNANEAKSLKTFTRPKKHEIQAILAASRGDLKTIQQIFAKSYYDCLTNMNILHPRFVAMPKNMEIVNNHSNWEIMKDTDLDIKYSPRDYQYFANHNDLIDFFDYLETQYSPDMLSTFRQSKVFNFDIYSQLEKGGSILHHGSASGSTSVVDFLIQHGGDEIINLKTANGGTPLHWAAGNGYLKIVKKLCDFGADFTASTNSWCVDVFGRDSGQLPIHWAASAGFSDVVEYLYGLSPLTAGLRDEKANSVVDMAKKGLHFSTARKVEELLNDEYVSVKIDVKSIEQNLFIDLNHIHRQKQAAQQQQQASHHVDAQVYY